MRKNLLLFYLLAAAACTTDKTPSTDTTKAADTTAKANDDNSAKDAVDKLRSGWKDAADKKDSTTVASMYTDDALLVTSEAPLAEGKDAILKTLGRLVNLTKINSIDSKHMAVMGDEAYDFGTFDEDVTMPGGKTEKHQGYYVVTLHKQSDGSWKITRHLSTVPLAKP